MADERAGQLRAQFNKVSSRSFPRTRKVGGRIVWFSLLCALGFLGAAFYDMEKERKLAAADNRFFFRFCADAAAAGVTPIMHWQPGYAWWLDADSDGIACEWGG